MFVHPKESLAKGQRRGGMLANRLWVGENVPYGLQVWVMSPPKGEEVSASLGRVRFQGQQMGLGGGFAAKRLKPHGILTCCGMGSLRPLGEATCWRERGLPGGRGTGQVGGEVQKGVMAGGALSVTRTHRRGVALAGRALPEPRWEEQHCCISAMWFPGLICSLPSP